MVWLAYVDSRLFCNWDGVLTKPNLTYQTQPSLGIFSVWDQLLRCQQLTLSIQQFHLIRLTSNKTFVNLGYLDSKFFCGWINVLTIFCQEIQLLVVFMVYEGRKFRKFVSSSLASDREACVKLIRLCWFQVFCGWVYVCK